jgi:hypothetical protein
MHGPFLSKWKLRILAVTLRSLQLGALDGQGQEGTAKVAQNRVINNLTLRDLHHQAITISVVTPVLFVSLARN